MPAIATDKKKAGNPVCKMAAAHIVVSPAAGPLTLSCDLLTSGITKPPIIPAISPEITGELEAIATPRQSGSATKKTVMLALTSCFKKDRR